MLVKKKDAVVWHRLLHVPTCCGRVCKYPVLGLGCADWATIRQVTTLISLIPSMRESSLKQKKKEL